MRISTLFSDKDITVGHVILEPGEKLPQEIHAAMSETISVLRGAIRIEGEGLVWLCEYGVALSLAAIDLGTGLEQAHIDAGHSHAVSNASAEKQAEFIAILRGECGAANTLCSRMMHTDETPPAIIPAPVDDCAIGSPARQDQGIAVLRGGGTPHEEKPWMSRWRPEVAAFADAMETKLRANEHKGGWKYMHPHDLLDRLREETRELKIAADIACVRMAERPDLPDHARVYVDRVRGEAADVANFAMMIADVCGALRKDEVGMAQAEACFSPPLLRTEG